MAASISSLLHVRYLTEEGLDDAVVELSFERCA
jgi:hypothetical protein